MTFHKGNVRQWHYDHCRAVCHPALVTTPSFQCDYCLEWFPKLDMQKQHECPAKLPLGRLHKIATENVEQQGFGASLVTPHERYIYTDGSGGNANQGAGWAAVLFRHVVTRLHTVWTRSHSLLGPKFFRGGKRHKQYRGVDSNRGSLPMVS